MNWGLIYGAPGRAETFMPQARALGAGIARLFFFWGKIEPEPGRFDWTVVDGFLEQVQPSDEVWITVCASSRWATRRATDFLPPSPAHEAAAYYRFVHALVTRCGGRVRYWQAENEPNSPVFWAGTAPEYVAQLKVFSQAVKDADPNAVVVLAGSDGLFNPADPQANDFEQVGLDFFDHLLREGREYFDVFDLHLYGDAYTIPARLDFMRRKMAALGYQRPIFAGEYNGPGFFDFAENWPYIELIMGFMSSVTTTDSQAQATQNTAEHDTIAALYARMATLPPQTQMFMQGCPPALEHKRHRINSRDLVMRNLLALSAGAQKTLCFSLTSQSGDRNRLMHLMFDKFKLMDYAEGRLEKRYPSAETLRLLTDRLAGVEEVRRIEIPERPAIYLFAVQRRERAPLLAVWERRDAFAGEDDPPQPFDWPWPAPLAQAVDAFGAPVPTTVANGRLSLALSLTPVFIEPGATV